MNTPDSSYHQLQFIPELNRRINRYFEERHIPRTGDARLRGKVITGLMWWVCSYVVLYVVPFSFWSFLLLYTLHGLSHIYLTFNVAHEANHNTVSQNQSLNKILRYCFDICGVNSYMWRILHNTGHHFCINVEGEDEAIIGRGVFRFSPHAPYKKIYRYQYLYAIPVYGLVTLDYVTVKDFKYFFFSDYRFVKNVRHRFKEYLVLFGGKLFYFTYMIVLPVLLLNIPLVQVLLAFAIMHFFLGVCMSLIFQISHVIETNEFPKSRDEYEAFAFHVLATTSDYATNSKLANWFLGGFNQHVIHHFYPHISHTHYPELTKILKATSTEYGVEYKESRSMLGALGRHFSLLRTLGRTDPMPLPSES